MFEFEQNVIQLFDSRNISYEFIAEKHYLTSENLNVTFVPNCSQEGYEINEKLAPSNAKTIRLWEDEYLQHQNIVKSRILSLLGISQRIYGRETVVKSISQHVLEQFLRINHLNVPIAAKYRFGLFYNSNKNEELVAVAAFSRSCPIQDAGITYKSHELIRFCSLLNTTVVGGLSKLIAFFETEIKPEHIMTYVDLEWSDGKTYEQLGFKAIANTPKQEFLLSPENNKRYLSKHLLQNKSKSEMLREGWKVINNQGNLKLVKYLK